MIARYTDIWKATKGRLKHVLVATTFGSGMFFVLMCFCLNGVLPVERWGSGGVYLAISGYVGASMLQAIFIPLMFDLASELRFGICATFDCCFLVCSKVVFFMKVSHCHLFEILS